MTITKYYNFSKILSFNATYNFICGARGLGKTYGAQKKAIKDAIKGIFNVGDEQFTENQFIYLRRYKEELRMSANTFFDAVHVEFPKWDFRKQGFEAQMAHAETRGEKGRDWITIGYFIELSRAQSYKSVAFPLVKTIIYDEFIMEKGLTRPLPDEANVFNNFYSTVDRYKDKTRVLFLANAVTIDNPYFIDLDIDPNNCDDMGILKLNYLEALNRFFVACHFPDSEEFKSEVEQTAFGMFIKGSEYAESAVNNEFKDAHDRLVTSKSPDAKPVYILETEKGRISVWYNRRENEYTVTSRLPEGLPIFTLVRNKMGEGKVLVTFSDKLMSELRTAFRHARVTFDKPATRNRFLEVFKR